MKKLLVLLIILSAPAHATNFYNPATGDVWVSQERIRPAQIRKVYYDDGCGSCDVAPPRFRSLPEMGNLGHNAYSEHYDYEE